MINEILKIIKGFWSSLTPELVDENNNEETKEQRLKKEQEYKKMQYDFFWKLHTGRKSSVRYQLYPIYIFDTFTAKNLYKDIINYLYINEPFYTIFTKLIKYWDQNDEWVKSNRTKTIIIKVDNQTNEAFKVFAKKELVFYTINNSFDYLKYNYFIKKDIQRIIIAILIFYIRNDEDKKLFLHKCKDIDMVNSILDSLSNKIEEYNFVHNFFENSKQFAKEYPYIDDNNDLQLLHYENIDIKNLKKFLPLNNF